jgi:outer membrane protein TolC
MDFKILAALSFMVSPLFLSATDTPAQTRFFALNDYLNAALKMSPQIASSRLERSSAVYGSEAVRQGYFPQVGINSQLIVAPSGGYDPAVTNGGEFGAQLGGSYILYNGGLKNLEIQKGDLGILQGTANLKKIQADVLYNTSMAFALAVEEKRELNVFEENVGFLKEYLTLVTELHAGGQANESDVLNTSVQLKNAMIEEDALKSSYQNALIDLSQDSGVPFNEVTDVDTSLAVVNVDTVFNSSGNVDLAAAELERQSADFDAEILKTRANSSVSLEADIGALTSLPNVQRGLSNVFGAEVGISFTLPIITHGYYDNQYTAAHLKAESISEQNSFLKQSLMAQFTQARNDCQEANKELAALESNLSTAEQNLMLTKAKYAGAGGSSLEVLNAIQLINQIEMSMEETGTTILVSVFKMQRLNYSGVLLNGQ